MKYEYATRFYDASRASLSEILAKFGNDGWQMVTLLKLDGYDRQLIMMREVEEDKQPEKWCGILPPPVKLEAEKTSNSMVRIKLICMNCKTELGDKDEIMLAFARRIVAQAELLERRTERKVQDDLFGYEFTQTVVQPHEDVTKVLNKYSQEGWKEVITVSIPDSFGSSHVIFRRKIRSFDGGKFAGVARP